MKTYIIQLEPHDDLTSVKDKLSWSKAQRVIFAWPRRGKVLGQFAELALIKREAEHLGIRLAFVTRDLAVKEIAQDLGIPVFNSVSVAERQAWPGQMPRKVPRELPVGYDRLSEMRQEFHQKPKASVLKEVTRIFAFILGIAAVVGLVGFFYPSAEVKIYPQRTMQELTFQVRADEQLQSFNVTGGIPAKEKRIELTLEQSGISTGMVDVTIETAHGIVHFESQVQQTITLPVGTILQTNDNQGLIFLLDEELTLDPNSASTADGSVHAQTAGLDGNLDSGTSLNVLTVYGDMVTASVEEPFTGGTEISSPTPTEDDYNELERQMLEQLKHQALIETRSSLQTDEVMIEKTLTDGTVISRVRSVEPGAPADHFSLKLVVEFSSLIYQQSSLVGLSETLLDANLDAGMTSVAGTLEISTPDVNVKLDADGNPIWNVHAQRWTTPVLDVDSLANQLIGEKIESALQRISNQVPLRQPSKIAVFPSWWRNMPFVPFRMKIEVN